MSFKYARLRSALAIMLAALAVQPTPVSAASHREAPITALDHVVVSTSDPERVQALRFAKRSCTAVAMSTPRRSRWPSVAWRYGTVRS